MDELDYLKYLFKLKEVERVGKAIKGRGESSAEHTWSSMMLAESFLKKVKGLDELRVLKLLMYHDLVEIEAGDTFILDDSGDGEKEMRERESFEKMKEKIPPELVDEYTEMFEEYEACETKESKFARAIDKLEPMIHNLDDRVIWKKTGFNEKVLREKKEKFM